MGRSKQNVQPHWRPNFVNASGLPDIKAIRTDFIVNFVSIMLAMLAGFYVIQNEYRAYSLNKTISDMEEQILAAEAADSASLRLSVKFRKLAENIVELEQFHVAPFTTFDFLTQISEMRPKGLIFKQLSLAERLQKKDATTQVIYSLNITGEVRSLTTLDEFKGELAEWDLLEVENYELEIDEILQGRDAKTGIFPYTLKVTLIPKAKEPAPENA